MRTACDSPYLDAVLRKQCPTRQAANATSNHYHLRLRCLAATSLPVGRCLLTMMLASIVVMMHFMGVAPSDTLQLQQHERICECL